MLNHVSKRGHWSQRCSMGFICGLLDGQSMTPTSWFSGKYIADWLCGAEHYLGPGQNCSGRWLLSSVRYFVATHICTHAGSWCRLAQPAHFCHYIKTRPIRWQMDRHYQLFPAYRHQLASHPAAYAPEPVHLCDATWILTRQGRYSVASGGCPKHDDVLPTNGGVSEHVSLGHRAGLR